MSGEANLINWFRRKRRPAGLVGLEIRTNGIALAKSSADRSRIQEFGFAECTAAKRLDTLKLLIEAHGCQGAPYNLVLLPDQYNLLQVERPNVDDAELADAVRWRIKDLIDMSLDDALVDVFDFPAEASRNRGRLLNVVVGRKPMIKDFVQLVENAGLELASIDIAELALRNVARRYEEDQKGLVLLSLRRGQGLMTMTRDSTLYLSRRLDVDLNALADPDRCETIGQQLALEVQRSLDYYESQLGQPPANRLFIASTDQADVKSRLLSENLAVPVAPLSCLTLLGDEPEDPSSFMQCLIAAGAALRVEAE